MKIKFKNHLSNQTEIASLSSEIVITAIMTAETVYTHHAVPWCNPPTHVAQQVLQLFFNNILQDLMIQAQLGIHLFKPTIFFFQIFKPLNVRGFHATVFGFPVVVASEMPCSRQTSFTNRPLSTSFRILTIWVSVKRDFFIARSPFGAV